MHYMTRITINIYEVTLNLMEYSFNTSERIRILSWEKENK